MCRPSIEPNRQANFLNRIITESHSMDGRRVADFFIDVNILITVMFLNAALVKLVSWDQVPGRPSWFVISILSALIVFVAGTFSARSWHVTEHNDKDAPCRLIRNKLLLSVRPASLAASLICTNWILHLVGVL